MTDAFDLDDVAADARRGQQAIINLMNSDIDFSDEDARGFLIARVGLRVIAEHERPVYDCDDLRLAGKVDEDGTQRLVCANCRYTMFSWGGPE